MAAELATFWAEKSSKIGVVDYSSFPFSSILPIFSYLSYFVGLPLTPFFLPYLRPRSAFYSGIPSPPLNSSTISSIIMSFLKKLKEAPS